MSGKSHKYYLVQFLKIAASSVGSALIALSSVGMVGLLANSHFFVGVVPGIAGFLARIATGELASVIACVVGFAAGAVEISTVSAKRNEEHSDNKKIGSAD